MAEDNTVSLLSSLREFVRQPTLILAAMGGITAVGASLAGFWFQEGPASVRIQAAEIVSLRAEVVMLERRLRAAELVRPPEGDPELALASAVDQLGVLSTRLGRLEEAISAEPERALSIPMLRKDLDLMDRELSVLSRTVDRVHSQNYLSIGTLLVIALSVAALAFNALRRDPN